MKQYYIHDDMFLNLDQIIVETLTEVFPKDVCIIINEFARSYFTETDINNSITFSNDEYLFWNDVYYELNKLLLPIHDENWYLNRSTSKCNPKCIPCNDMLWRYMDDEEETHVTRYDGLAQKMYFDSYIGQNVVVKFVIM